MLAYFQEKSAKYKPNTLWYEYSKLRTMIHLNTKVDISSFLQLAGFLKRKSKGYTTKKSKAFEREEINRFFTEADDENYLLLKTVLIFGVAGACRRCELTKLAIKDFADLGDIIVVQILDTKTSEDREFVIGAGVVPNVNLLDIIRKYLDLRSQVNTTDRLFVAYRGGRCVSQPVGINTIGGIPAKIAAFLGLQDCYLFTGHCYRRTSASLLVDAGAGLILLKQHGGWKSSKVAEAYVASSLKNKQRISNGILGGIYPSSTSITPQASTSKQVTPSPFNGLNATSSSNSNTKNDSSLPASVAVDTVKESVVSTIVASQQITIGQSNERQPLTAISDNTQPITGTDFFRAMNRNLQGCNMFNCTVNINVIEKKN